MLAVLLGLLPFLASEMLLRALDMPSRPPAADPFVDLGNLKPLFEPDPSDSSVLRIAPDRLNLFRPTQFRRDKSPETVRVFALGGSTTQGEPYSTETAFPAWLELCLRNATQRDVEVVNCGGLSYASYRVLAILREVLNYQPDLIVVYTGHNEYLERRSYAGYNPESASSYAMGRLSQLRVVQLAKLWVGKDGSRPPPAVETPTKLAEEVDALLDYQGGLEDYVRGDPPHAAVRDHFRWNIQQMADECRRASVPLVMVRPVGNLLDCPPFKFTEKPGLDASALAEFRSAWQTARDAEDAAQAKLAAERALEIDPEHAGLNYMLGRLHFAAGDHEQAHTYLLKAKDNDVCPLRAYSDIAEAVSDLAERYQLTCVDAEELFQERSRHGIVGDQWLVDHIHPSVEGHQLLGMKIAEQCLASGLLAVQNQVWEQQMEGQFRERLAELGEDYFHRGKQRLEGLMLWTQGRARKVRPGAVPGN